LHAPFEYTRSAIQLPNARLTAEERTEWIAEYNSNGGASAFELEMVAQINAIREYHGLNPLIINTSLMQAARFYTQTMANLNLDLGSSVGPYGGSRATAEAFGVRIGFTGESGNRYGWSGGSGFWGGWTYASIVTGWMNAGPPYYRHRAFILSPHHRYIGFGSHLGGRRGVFHYLLLSGE